MIEQYSYLAIIGISLLFGGIPFAFLAIKYFESIGLSKVFSRKYPNFAIFENNWLAFFFIAISFVFDFTKVIFLIKLSDVLLGQSDISLIIPVLFCFISNFIAYSLILRKTELSMSPVWGAIFFLSPMVITVFFLIALGLYLVIGKKYLSRYLILLLSFLWLLISGTPLSYLYIILLSILYIFINNIIYAGKNKMS